MNKADMSERGFTLVELVVIMIVVGILAVTVAPRFADKSVFESRGFRDETLSLLRFAQKSAIAQRRTVCVTVTSTGATLSRAGAAGATSCNTTLDLPFTPKGGTGLTGTDFYFLASGAPSAGGTLSVSGSDPITVEAVTGYVH